MGFLLDKKSQIVLYGASHMAINWCEKALRRGFQIIAFLDKNAEKIKEVNGIPVFTLEEWRGGGEDENIVVIIMLQNALQHYEIMLKLYKKKITKVIGFPVKTYGLNLEAVADLRYIYNDCIKFQFASVLEDIPEYVDIVESESEQCCYKVIYESAVDVVMYFPAELCFAEKKRTKNLWVSDYTEEAEKLLSKFVRERNVNNISPYWQLFDYLEGKKDDCETYLKIFGERGHIAYNNGYDHILIKDRASLYELYLQEMNLNSDFFRESPAEGRIDEDGKVYIQDGLHRSVFLLRSGWQWLPVRVKKEELKKIENQDVLSKIKKCLKITQTKVLEYPIEHPYFCGFPTVRYDLKILWNALSNAILENDIIFNTIFDISMTNAYFARNFLRLGCQQAYYHVCGNSEFTELVNSLFIMCSLKMVHREEILSVALECDLIVINNKMYEENASFWAGLLDKTLKALCVVDLSINDGREEICGESNLIKKGVFVKKYLFEGKLKGLFLLWRKDVSEDV